MLNVRTLVGLPLVMLGAQCGGDGSSSPQDGGDAVTGDECSTAAECEALGEAPCGQWECRGGYCDVVCENCDDADFDGYGEGDGCAGTDCDDADDAIHPGAAEVCDAVDNDCQGGVDDGIVQACYGGPAGTESQGACRGGTQHCFAGELGPCIGEIRPAGESCNGADDDCDGQTDEDLGDIVCGLGACRTTVAACVGGTLQNCVAGMQGTEVCDGSTDEDCNGAVDELESCGCIHVSAASGDDANTGAPGQPVATITTGIARALAGGDTRVCVAQGVYSEAVTMEGGISVYGGYQEAAWARNPGIYVTEIAAVGGEGVVFPSSVTTTTALDGFTISGLDGQSTSAAVTVDGSTGAVITGNMIVGAGTGETTLGIEVLSDGTPLIARNRIFGGNGTALSAGVRSVGAAPVVQGNCDTFDPATGACTKFCTAFGGAPNRGIFGHSAVGTGDSFAVLLEDSPGALVSRNTLCGVAVSGAGGDLVVGVHVSGRAEGTVLEGNQAAGLDGTLGSIGMAIENCDGDSPWIVRNTSSGEGSVADAPGEGLRSAGDCHPVIEGNEISGAFGGTQDPVGVRCARVGDDASRCALVGNRIAGNVPFFGPALGSTGVWCEPGCCARITDNEITGVAFSGFGTPGTAATALGLVLESTGTVVDANVILAGKDGACGTTSAVALEALDAYARIENNVVSSEVCGNADPAGGFFAGLRVTVGEGRNEVDVHSNTLFGIGNDTTCSEAALAIEAGPGVGEEVARGVFRNNILYSGACDTSHAVSEGADLADPRVLENNLLWPGPDGVLYRDEAAVDVTVIADVNALADAGAASNLSADPLFVSLLDIHLQAGSPCIDAGTAAGAPVVDLDGTARPQGTAPDIGAFEFVP